MLFCYCCVFIFMSLAALVLAIITQIAQRNSQFGVEFAQPWSIAICLLLVFPLYFLHRRLRDRISEIAITELTLINAESTPNRPALL